MEEIQATPVLSADPIQMIDDKLTRVIPHVPQEKERYHYPVAIRKDLLPRAIMSLGLTKNLKGPAIAKILADNKLPGTYGSMKVLIHHARADAKKSGVTENQEQFGLAAFIKERIGEQATQELLVIAKEIVEAAPKYVRQKKARTVAPQETIAPVADAAPTFTPQNPSFETQSM